MATLLVASAAVTVLPGVTATAEPAAEHGTVTAYEPRPPGWAGSDRAWYVEYTTDSPTGGTTVASGAVLVPEGAPPPGGWPVIAWGHGTSGLAPQCGFTATDGRYDADIVARFQDQGYAVVAPDYLGLGPTAETPHPYLHSRTEATATVDLVRAAVSANPDLSDTWAVVGVSQGGHAALNAGHLAGSRAPELDFRGTAALAPATNIDKAFALVGPYVPEIPGLDGATAYFAAALAGLRVAAPDLDLAAYLTPTGAELVDGLETLCVQDWGDRVGGASLGSLMTRPAFDGELASRLQQYMAVPTAGYDRPVLVTHGYADTTVPVVTTLALLGEFQVAGTQYEFHTYDVEHGGIVDASWPQLLPYLAGILAPA